MAYIYECYGMAKPKKKDLYAGAVEDGYMKIVGPRDEIERFIADFREETRNAELCMDNHPYASCWIPEWFHFSESNLRAYPACQYIIHKGLQKFGTCDYTRGTPGSEPVSGMIFADPSGAFRRDTNRKWDYLQLKGKYTEGQVEIQLKNGEVLTYEKTASPLAVFSGLKTLPLSFTFLAEMCGDKTAVFQTELEQKIGTLDQIISITASYREAVAEIPQKYSKKLPESSLARFVDCYCETLQEQVCLVEKKSLNCTTVVTVFAPEDPATGKYDCISREVDRKEEPAQQITGIADGNQPEMVFVSKTGKSCTLTSCKFDGEVLEIPATATGKVKNLGNKCLVDLKNVRKIILPRTLTSFGKGNFYGCDKLEQVVYEDAQDSKEPLILRDGKLLKGVITLAESFEVPKDCITLCNYAFSNCPNLKTVTLHGAVWQMEVNLFKDCKKLRTLILQRGFEYLHYVTLQNSQINKVILADGTTVKFKNKVLCRYFKESPKGVRFASEEIPEEYAGQWQVIPPKK